MKTSITQTHRSETALLLRFLTKKIALRLLRWGFWLSAGLYTWLCFEALPSVFFWLTMTMMFGGLGVHALLHARTARPGLAKQFCRYAFFLSFPMLFIFTGNRVAVWSVSDYMSGDALTTTVPTAAGEVQSKEYKMIKELQKEKFKDPGKFKKGFKKFMAKKLMKAKPMDRTVKILLIVLGALLLIIIVTILLFVYAVNESTDSCLGSDDNNGCLD